MTVSTQKQNMTALNDLLTNYRKVSKSEREKGTYFEELIRTYFRHEASYKDLYSDVWLYSDWAGERCLCKTDTGIDLVAKTRDTNEYHAIQCKFYDEERHKVQRDDLNSFFTESGKKPFTRRVIVTTTDDWGVHAEDALKDQQPPVTRIDLLDLENSQIDWAKYQSKKEPVLKPKKELRPHQKNALRSVKLGLSSQDRGKLIMACGTGKTFTSLKIAEELAGKGKRVLFLVPSLSLLSQTLTEWTQESKTPLHSFAVCSDSAVGKKRKKDIDIDIVQTFTHELRYPATTEAVNLAREVAKRHDKHHMSVIFSTYHSIDVISKAQHEHGLEGFDLIVCDEAHRTTGATFEDETESNFVKIHDAGFIKADKRLYMTATPRIYANVAKATAEQDNAVLCSMDDKQLYGNTLYTITFSEAVARGLLVDYKVIVLTIDENYVSERIQVLLKDDNNQLKVDDAAKIIGCWKALSKQSQEEQIDDSDLMQRALAFCQVIEPNTTAKTHKVSSKNIASMFQEVVDAYLEYEDKENPLICQVDHVDGGMNASTKEQKLDWLKQDTPANTCRILSNVRCLSEGVDVPALDAVLFLTPRNSQIDVVQSVGRVMRKAPNKKLGYVILPVVIPANTEPHIALDDNKTYRVVWEVLQALKSHDDRFDAHINKLDLIGKDIKKMEVIAITGKVQKKAKKSKKTSNKNAGKGQHSIGEAEQSYNAHQTSLMDFEVGDMERALYAKVVKKCGNRSHWEDWANDIAKIANTHISRITTIVNNPDNSTEAKAFNAFADELRDDLNDSITDDEVIEMLAQHLITKPVFDALFEEYSFASNNPVSKAMQQVLDLLQEHGLDKEADTLQRFYDSVKLRAAGIDNAQGKQKIVVELYDKFFRNAFPKMTERLGIVYTPVEVVDFIIHSINDLLQQEFGQSLGDKGVHIIDPFTGTGTFITRLLQSGLISKEQLPHKYKHEIHANEIVLLAYYIAAINIEAVYHSIVGDEYQPFEGICLTDTFQMHEKDDLISELLVDNSVRRVRQKELDIRVIMGNPPYSVGQKSENDNNSNIAYPELDQSIRNSYGAESKATTTKALMDSYIKAIRWGSERIGDSGIMAYVSGSAWVERSFADGMRKCLQEEFSSIYVFNLRGDVRKNMLSKGRAKEGGNIFDSGSMNGIAITLFIKNPKSKDNGSIYYHDIGDDLSTRDKLSIISSLKSIEGVRSENSWGYITPDQHNDWINQRDNSAGAFIQIGNKKDKSAITIFNNYSLGINTGRDSWCYNYSKKIVSENMESMTQIYNDDVKRYKDSCAGLNKVDYPRIDNFVESDPAKIKWAANLKKYISSFKYLEYTDDYLTINLYRPFNKQWVCYSRDLNERVYQMPHVFPNTMITNRVISLAGVGGRAGFSVLMMNTLSCLDTIEKGQCFPLYLYEKTEIQQTGTTDLFANINNQPSTDGFTRKDAISDDGLAHFKAAYPTESFSKEDMFYYIYGLLHSPEYRERYADNLTKELPRIPCVKTAKDFWSYSKAGRDLAELHINYETMACYPVTLKETGEIAFGDESYYVTKMKFSKIKQDGKSVKDKTTVVYNAFFTIQDIPLEAYDYIVNGKPALEWVMERQAVTTDKKSGIVNDANLWATETMNNDKYPLELFMRVITVSLETMKIVNALPKLDID